MVVGGLVELPLNLAGLAGDACPCPTSNVTTDAMPDELMFYQLGG